MKITVGKGDKKRELDLSKALPLQVKDARYLGKEGFVTPDGQTNLTDLNKLMDFAVYLAKKVDPELTDEEFDEVSIEEVNKAINEVNKTLVTEGGATPPTGTKSS